MITTYIIFILLFISCGSENNYEKIIIGKTIKVYHEEYSNNSENFIFKWSSPIGPNGIETGYIVKEHILLFTPMAKGKYEIRLNIADISDEDIEDKVFYYEAFLDTIIMANKSDVLEDSIRLKNKIKQTKTNNPLQKAPIIETKTRNNTIISQNNVVNTKYAIQIAAWPGLAEARMNQLSLMDIGFDSYIEKYIDKNGQQFHRVRIGNFEDKNIANMKKIEVENVLSIKTWLAIINNK